MPVAPYTHREGGEHWIIEVPNKGFNRRMLNTQFVNGIARTKFMEKAKEFDESFGYTVIAYPGAPKWVLAPNPDLVSGRVDDWREEDSIAVVLEDEEEWSETGQFEDEVTEAEAAKAGLVELARGNKKR